MIVLPLDCLVHTQSGKFYMCVRAIDYAVFYCVWTGISTVPGVHVFNKLQLR